MEGNDTETIVIVVFLFGEILCEHCNIAFARVVFQETGFLLRICLNRLFKVTR